MLVLLTNESVEDSNNVQMCNPDDFLCYPDCEPNYRGNDLTNCLPGNAPCEPDLDTNWGADTDFNDD